MKIVKFLGGLGNQMFQYAFYRTLSQKFNQVKADISGFENYKLHNGFELDRVFGVKIRKATKFEIDLMDPDNRKWSYRKLRRLLFVKPSYFGEKVLFSYHEQLLIDRSAGLYEGYWQHYQYAEQIKELLAHDFTFPQSQSPQHLNMLDQLVNEESSVAIHVRRGDYLKDPYLGGLATDDYFKQGISLIKTKVKMPAFYVFSDDIPWCKSNLNLPEAVYVDWNTGSESFRDMELMSHCKHAIISNSSFSWWAAWLNQNPEKIVIVPRVWYQPANGILNTQDMHPPSWVRI